MLKISKKFLKLLLSVLFIIGLSTFTYIRYQQKSRLTQPIKSFNFSRPDSRKDEIKGEIITLKRLRPEYFDDFYKMHNDPSIIQRLYEAVEPEGIQYNSFMAHLKYELKKKAKGLVLSYVIFDNKEDNLIGNLEIREPDPDDPGQFGCWINPKYWGGGRLYEAFKLISQEYFRLNPNTEKFNAHVKMSNLRGYFALKKCGFKLIKTLHFKDMSSRYFLEYYNPKIEMQQN
ncbi:GNAT family N-acetyltransferase [Candidatus Dependentiae bacterium]|nr:GNAT family N-acetyltransferase [Candidatus Dependentiae bacterium]